MIELGYDQMVIMILIGMFTGLDLALLRRLIMKEREKALENSN